MVRRFLLVVSRAHLVLAALAACLILAPPGAEGVGDRLQIALPALALACAATGGGGREFAMRFVATITASHAVKRGLGDAGINRRPSGAGKGFPSAHTVAAVMGASALAHDCLADSALAQATVVIAAGFVGGSRLEAGAHDIWQVLAGAVLGLFGDRALRRNADGRAFVARVARIIAHRLRRMVIGWVRRPVTTPL